MHTLWVREHNRIAKFLLSEVDSNATKEEIDEMIFQQAKRIVVAEYQHIIFNEWLPLIIGRESMTTYGLWPLSKGYSVQYLDSFDPRITNEFATAAFRFGHSLIPSTFKRVNPVSQRTSKNLSLREIFFKPEQWSGDVSLFDELINGLSSQRGEEWDNIFSEDIKNHLFETVPNAGGMDLVALNIQRGRDHGLPGYNDYRNSY